ncbi:wd domain-containing, partial [Nannochloropsis gaditana CCMP526]|uniref:wd domain-containing n=1 Tax=Nannochloropsis gaditana (strain CCMP526) TaxID=1093141 RepID=UPI00029F580C
MEGRVAGTEDKPEGGVVSSIKQKTHHNATVWSARHLPQNRDVFVTCGGEGGLALWQYHYATPSSSSSPSTTTPSSTSGPDPGALSLLNARLLSPQPLVAFDWHREKTGLCAIASLDQCLRVHLVTRL